MIPSRVLNKIFATSVAGLVMITALVVNVSMAAADQETSTEQFVERLYRSLLDRGADTEGKAHWASELDSHTHPKVMLEHFLATSEGIVKEPTIAEVYERTLFRAPDSEGLDYWESQDFQDAVIAITMSEEAVEKWGHQPYVISLEATRPEDTPDYFVVTEYGVWLPPVMLNIRHCESKGDYRARNTRSSASGAYQFLEGTAREAAERAGRPDLIGYGDNVAGSWAPADQDKMALVTWEHDGTRPWNASKHCWG